MFISVFEGKINLSVDWKMPTAWVKHMCMQHGWQSNLFCPMPLRLCYCELFTCDLTYLIYTFPKIIWPYVHSPPCVPPRTYQSTWCSWNKPYPFLQNLWSWNPQLKSTSIWYLPESLTSSMSFVKSSLVNEGFSILPHQHFDFLHTVSSPDQLN